MIASGLVACDRPITDRDSSLVIDMPKSLGKVGSLALPANRTACFGVSVSGPGISAPSANSCSPTMGRIGGFVKLGDPLSVNVPKGKDRKLDLYVFLQEEGVNQACPQMSGSLSATQLLNTYKVATKEGVDTTAPETTVTITIAFPGLENHIASQMNLPDSCIDTSLPSVSNPYRFDVSSDVRTASGGGIFLKGRVGSTIQDKILTGSNIKLYVRE
ncbi:hypothetical protein GW916_06330 [bacterium]|nr:hypothetical protein [bacterium]